jgi:hypothetical protein
MEHPQPIRIGTIMASFLIILLRLPAVAKMLRSLKVELKIEDIDFTRSGLIQPFCFHALFGLHILSIVPAVFSISFCLFEHIEYGLQSNISTLGTIVAMDCVSTIFSERKTF